MSYYLSENFLYKEYSEIVYGTYLHKKEWVCFYAKYSDYSMLEWDYLKTKLQPVSEKWVKLRDLEHDENN